MRDAAVQHNQAMAEREEELEVPAVLQSNQAAASTKGRLPNLEYGLLGRSVLEQHSRYVSLPRAPLPPQHQRVPDEELPAIPQGSDAWFAARADAITASNAALWLELERIHSCKNVGTAGLPVRADTGDADLQHAFTALMAAGGQRPPPPAQQRSAFSSCAMQMGSVKEPDVLLTHAQHMDNCKRCSVIYIF